MNTPIWHLLDKDTQELLKSCMPKDWLPPGDRFEKIKIYAPTLADQEEEHLMQIDKEMRKPSRMRK
uniref:Uncharacterized protein n=1 Tax=viral metagenome TaxID=1070528 RepID=A0A6M3JIN5_9ZZZZ